MGRVPVQMLTPKKISAYRKKMHSRQPLFMTYQPTCALPNLQISHQDIYVFTACLVVDFGGVLGWENGTGWGRNGKESKSDPDRSRN